MKEASGKVGGEKDMMKKAEDFWKVLDDMAESNPEVTLSNSLMI